MANAPILLDKTDIFWLNLAEIVSNYSNDPYTKVGCVIVSRQRVLVSAGFNTVPEGINFQETTREEKNRVATHAEDHALSISGPLGAGATAYLWPVEPCRGCAEKLVKAGIHSVVAPIDESSDVFKRWLENLLESREVFEKGGVRKLYAGIESPICVNSEKDRQKLETYSETLRLLWQK